MPLNKKIIHILIIISLLFLSLLVYLTYFEFFIKDKIVVNSYNQRLWKQEDDTIRGNIYDREDKLLATSKIENNTQKRIYPYTNLYSQVIGYNSKTYGKSLLEARYNKYLLNINDFHAVFDIKNKLTGEENTGNNLFLTIDHELQTLANKLLKSRQGAVVAIQPKTGEVLAMVSKPDFNPTSDILKKRWEEMVESPEAPFLPRATQGLYTPGSTYKVVTSIPAIEKGMDLLTFEDKGTIIIDGKEINNTNNKAYGNIDLKKALEVSSNVVFSEIATTLGEKELVNIADRVGIEKNIAFDIPLNKSQFSYNKMNEADLASIGIGQGKLLLTPLHMAMISASIANDGIMMKPKLVNEIATPNGLIIYNQKPSIYNNVMDKRTAEKLKDMMKAVVETGTGTNAKIRGISVAGKTGTAENELSIKQKNKTHAWFIGFAPVEEPKIAVAVILEYSGSTGGQLAAPIARDIMKLWIDKN